VADFFPASQSSLKSFQNALIGWKKNRASKKIYLFLGM